MKIYIFDSSAILKFYIGETLSSEYTHLEADLDSNRAEAYTTTLIAAEIYYILHRKQGEKGAEEKFAELKYRFRIIPIDTELAHEMGRIKATERVSLADASVLALTRQLKGKLIIGRDKELEKQKDTIRI